MKIIIENSKPIRAAASFIRMSVFVIERGIALNDEFDDKDSDDMIYAVVFAEKIPVATCRFELFNNHTLKIGRVATLKNYRGQGLGAKVIKAMEEKGRQFGLDTAIIHSELTAQTFYEKMGYQVSSDVYIEDAVKCVTVKKHL